MTDQQGLGVEPANRLTTWGNSSSIPSGDDAAPNDGEQPLAHDGPVLEAGDELDPAGAVTARTVEAGPSHVGEGTPSDEEGESSGQPRGNGEQDEQSSEPEPARKRGKRSISVDSDELDQDTPVAPIITPPAKKKKKAKPGPLKPIAQSMVCGECDKNFTVVRRISGMWIDHRLHTPKNIPKLRLPTYVFRVATL